MSDALVRVVDHRAVVKVSGGELLILKSEQLLIPIAARAEGGAVRAEDALAEMLAFAAGAPEAPSIVNKANLDFGNVAQAAMAMTQFALPVNRYEDTEPVANRAAFRIIGTSTGAHTDARMVQQIKMIADGSGGNGPLRSDTSLILSAHKKNWFLTAAKGEIGTLSLDFRQGGDGDSDASAILINGQIVAGAGQAFSMESVVSILDATTTMPIQSMRAMITNMDAITGYMAGWYVNKEMGAGGGALIVNQLGGTWENAVELLAPGGLKPLWSVKGTGQNVFFDDNGVNYFGLGNANGTLRINRNGAAIVAITNSGGVAASDLAFTGHVFAGANQVLGPRRTGWSAATGGTNRASFDASTVTIAQLAQRVAAMIDDGMAHGFIGA